MARNLFCKDLILGDFLLGGLFKNPKGGVALIFKYQSLSQKCLYFTYRRLRECMNFAILTLTLTYRDSRNTFFSERGSDSPGLSFMLVNKLMYFCNSKSIPFTCSPDRYKWYNRSRQLWLSALKGTQYPMYHARDSHPQIQNILCL